MTNHEGLGYTYAALRNSVTGITGRWEAAGYQHLGSRAQPANTLENVAANRASPALLLWEI